jgi:hypothetical protein
MTITMTLFRHCLQHLTPGDIEQLSRVFVYETYYPGVVIAREGDAVDPLRALMVLARGEVGVTVRQMPNAYELSQRKSKFQKGVASAVRSTGMSEQQLLDPWAEEGDTYVVKLSAASRVHQMLSPRLDNQCANRITAACLACSHVATIYTF